ncbi:MAG: transcription antitermination factor NusB [Clostridia bacterium]|nr:transcription antitermination factor NusB [Clostridia bacterium]
MTRHEERVQIFTLLYEYTFYGDTDAGEFLSSRENDDAFDATPFVKTTFQNTVLKMDEIDAKIAEYAVGWKISRMSRVTRSVLRLASYELLYTDVPPKAVINEALEISKEYDDEKAAPFVNGILNKLARGIGKIGDENSDKK